MDTKRRVLRAAILTTVVLLCLSISPLEPALAAGGGSKRICSVLGDDPKPSILDQDIFKFNGTKGEKVTVTLEQDSSGSHTGKQANLSLVDEITRTFFFRTTTGALPRTITAVLPSTGKYLILVAELPRLRRLESFRGDYCLTLASSAGAYATLAPTPWVEPTGNSAPVANAGPDQTVPLGAKVYLDGSKSTDADGDALTYKWSTVSKPAGSTATLSNPSAVNPTVVVDKPGTYVVQLIVNDGKLDSAPDTVSISTENSKPIANAGQDQYVTVGSLVTLDGRNSYDPDSDLISYKWAINPPSGSNANLNNPTSVMPTFTPDIPGQYRISLIVNDGQTDSAPDEVIIIAARPNVAPTAVAGKDQSVATGSWVYLDGKGSFDPDGDPLTYRWQMVSQPPDGTASLDNPSSSTPTFFADKDGQYIIVLTVNDGQLDSIPDDVIIISATPNAPPVSYAGDDQTVSKNSTIQLDGRGSSDPDNDPLNYSWTIVSKPSGSASELDDPGSPTPQILADKVGEYVFTLIVYDGKLYSNPDTVVIKVANNSPIADAGPDQDGVVGNPINLNGGGSSDPNGDTLTYQWTIVSPPIGNSASIINPTSVTPIITPNVPGVYVIQLVVNDGSTDSSPDTVKLRVQTTVPDVVGQPQASAEAAIIAAGLTVGAITQVNSAVVPGGSVISQSPVGGSQVPAGSPVSLTISLGPATVLVPNVVGMTQAGATSTITSAKLAVGTITQTSSGTVPAGNVISQNPAAGSSVSQGSSVNIVVSLGDGAAVIGPEGGVVEVNNPSNPLYGFRLEVPPGALSQPATITVNSVPCDSIDAILVAHQLASHEKKCLTAFSAKPDGLVFNSPVTARVPVPSLTPGWTPFQVQVDLDKQTYWIVPGEIVYLGQENVFEINLTHFSELAVVEAQSNAGGEGVCFSCEGFKSNLAFCDAIKDPDEDACCLIELGQRLKCPGYENCYGPARCCKELGFTSKTECGDFTPNGTCQIVECKTTIYFPWCGKDGLTIVDNDWEQSSECPKGMKVQLTINSDQSSICPCEQVKMYAVASGVNQDGIVIFSGRPFPAFWEFVAGGSSVADFAGEIPPNGKVVKGLKPGIATVRASSLSRGVTYGEFSLTVKDPGFTFTSLEASDYHLDVGQQLNFFTQFLNCASPPSPDGVTWGKMGDPDVVTITPASDGSLEVTAKRCGSAIIWAEYAYQNCSTPYRPWTSDVVTVRGTPPRIITVDPLTLGINESKPLTGKVTDANGYDCPDFKIDKWDYLNPLDIGIATVDSAGNVTGHSEGTVYLLAWSGDEFGMVQVKVLPAKVVVKPLTATICVNAPNPLTLTATVTDALGNLYTGCDVQWQSNSNAVQLPPNPQGPKVSVLGVSETPLANVCAVCGIKGKGCANVTVKAELATININPPYNPPYNAPIKVFTSMVELTGTIVTECGQGLVDSLVVTVEDATDQFQVYPPVPVGTNGSFSVAVSLHWGVNRLTFETYVGTQIVHNNMAGIDLDRVSHCLKSGNTSSWSLPSTSPSGIPLSWHSADLGIASVGADGTVTALSDGWARIIATVGNLTVVSVVGVSSATNYVPTYSGDPFYKPEPVPPPPPPAALEQILSEVSYYDGYWAPYEISPSDLNGKYWVGDYNTGTCALCYWYYKDIWDSEPICIIGSPGGSPCNYAGFLYDGTSFFHPIITGDAYTQVFGDRVNEIGQAVFRSQRNDQCNCSLTLPPYTYKLFLYDQGLLIPISVPGAYRTISINMNNSGKIMLIAYDYDAGETLYGTYRGKFLYDIETASFSEIPKDSVQINDAGKILGSSGFPPSGCFWWVYKDGVFETVTYSCDPAKLYESGQVLLENTHVLLTRCAPED